MTIRTGRLHFRDFVATDFDAVHAYASDPMVTRFTAWGPNTEVETRSFLDRMLVEATARPRQNYTFAVLEIATGRVIGGCRLELDNSTGPQFVLGYCFHSEWWQLGMGTEAVRAILPFGFGDLGAHRIAAHVFLGNAPSARLLGRLGFRVEGTLHQHTFVRGAWHDEMVHALLRHEWQEADPSLKKHLPSDCS